MKRILALILCGLAIVSMSACKKTEDKENVIDHENQVVQNQENVKNEEQNDEVISDLNLTATAINEALYASEMYDKKANFETNEDMLDLLGLTRVEVEEFAFATLKEENTSIILFIKATSEEHMQLIEESAEDYFASLEGQCKSTATNQNECLFFETKTALTKGLYHIIAVCENSEKVANGAINYLTENIK